MAHDGLRATILEVGSSFGYQLKEKQLEAMATFLSGRDVFVSLPTGYGKSAIYALLPMVFDEINHIISGKEGSIVVCISPLTSLMMDQGSKFSLKGISMEFVGEDQHHDEAINCVLKGKGPGAYLGMGEGGC
uniref:DNA 3'-5' helicase n=1 Tax=Amphimedon queenslandica TaxID=400682 RepID=A0A1X7V9J4_AMPQE